LLPTE